MTLSALCSSAVIRPPWERGVALVPVRLTSAHCSPGLGFWTFRCSVPWRVFLETITTTVLSTLPTTSFGGKMSGLQHYPIAVTPSLVQLDQETTTSGAHALARHRVRVLPSPERQSLNHRSQCFS